MAITLAEAVRAAYTFGAERGKIFTYVVRRQDGSYYWSHEVDRISLLPESTGEIVWSHKHDYPADDIAETSEADWEAWLEAELAEVERTS